MTRTDWSILALTAAACFAGVLVFAAVAQAAPGSTLHLGTPCGTVAGVQPCHMEPISIYPLNHTWRETIRVGGTEVARVDSYGRVTCFLPMARFPKGSSIDAIAFYRALCWKQHVHWKVSP